jgi:hypothetical protein
VYPPAQSQAQPPGRRPQTLSPDLQARGSLPLTSSPGPLYQAQSPEQPPGCRPLTSSSDLQARGSRPRTQSPDPLYQVIELCAYALRCFI